MEPVITLNDVSKEFKVLKSREGIKGSIQNLFSRDYKIVNAVNHISMRIEQGEIIGYLGPNGAGKSTTIKMMSGVLVPTSGEIRVNGLVPYKSRRENSEKIGVVFGQRSQLWWSLPLIESFKLLRDIYQIPQKEYEDTLAFYESIVDIKGLYSKPVRQMSLGQLLMGGLTLIYAWNRLALPFTFTTFLLLVVALLSASLFMIAIMNAAAATCFWIINNGYVMVTMFKFTNYARYPANIYSGIFKFIFTFLIPIAFVAYYPSLVFLRPDSIPVLTYLSPVLGILFFWLSYKLWMRGATTYSGTGS